MAALGSALVVRISVLYGSNPADSLTIGEFALLEASYAIVRIVQVFPQLSIPADEKIEPIGAERQNITLTMAPADGCRVRLYE